MSRLGFDRRDLVVIAVGGLLGAAVRWLITDAGVETVEGGWFAYSPGTVVAASPPGFPWRTLVANGLGCLVLGGALALGAHGRGRPRLLRGLGTGFCGSLTTFSTFAVELAGYLRGPTPAGEPALRAVTSPGRAVGYLMASIVIGAMAFVAGRAAVNRRIDPASP